MNFIKELDLSSNDGAIILLHNISAYSNLCENDLNQHEHERADRILDKNDKSLYVKQRLILRFIFSSVLGCKPAEVQYSYKYSKPRLVTSMIADFNISHSADTFAIFIVNEGSCGIDVDFQRKLKYSSKIAKRFFTEREQQYINNHSDAKSAFFEVWSKKEAIVKMHATGMFADAKNYDVFDKDLKCSSIKIANGFLSYACEERLKNIQLIKNDFLLSDS